MRLEKGNEVFAANGDKIGTLSRVVIDATTRDVTDLVVDKGVLGHEKVIPVTMVDTERDDRITLRDGDYDFPDYKTAHYIPSEETTQPSEHIQSYYWYPPTNFQFPTNGMMPDGRVVPDYVVRKETSIPEGRVTIDEGAQVISADDKHIGNVEQVIAQADNHVTHLVVGKGFLLKEHKMVPSTWITEADENRVHLSVDSKVFERLPDYQPS